MEERTRIERDLLEQDLRRLGRKPCACVFWCSTLIPMEGWHFIGSRQWTALTNCRTCRGIGAVDLAVYEVEVYA